VTGIRREYVREDPTEARRSWASAVSCIRNSGPVNAGRSNGFSGMTLGPRM
jgi:hypothetical protein